MKVFLSLVVLGLSVVGFAAETKTFDSNGLKEVSIHNSAGKVNVVAKSGPTASVSANKKKFEDSCKLTWERNGDSLDIKVKGTGLTDNCEVDFDVSVPKAVDLEVKLGAGNLSVQGTEGELEYTVGSGEVSAKGIFNKIDGKLGNGKVDVTGLSGGGEVKTGNGSVNLTFAKKELKGELEVSSGNGNATLKFPKTAKIKTEFKSGLGQLTNELGDKADADFKVSMKSGMGNLNIKSY